MTSIELRRGSDRKSIIVQEILATRIKSDQLKSRKQVRLFLEQYVG